MADVEKWKRERLGVRAKATVNRELAWLKRLFNVAIRDEKCERNPAAPVKLNQLNNARLRYQTDAEESALRNIMVPEDFELVELAVNTGLRRGELFNLRWKSIDFRNGILTVDLSKHGERRHIAINERVLEILKARQQRFHSAYIVPSETMMTALNAHNFVMRVFNPSVKLAGIHSLRWHDLRHTFASRLIMAGVSLRATQELMGHKSVVMTLRYSHLAPSHLKDAVNRLNKPTKKPDPEQP